MKKKYLTAAAVLLTLICAFALTSCGGGQTGGNGDGAGNGNVTDASSLIEAHKSAQNDVESVHMDATTDMNMTMNSESLEAVLGSSELSMPFVVEMSLDSGKETAHGTTKTTVDLMGQSQEQNAEAYYDLKEGAAYVKAAESSAWTKTESTATVSSMLNSADDFSDEMLKDAEYAETEDGYTLTFDATNMGSIINELNSMDDLSASGVTLEDCTINKGTVVYTFDKETCLIKHVNMTGVDMTAKGSMQGMEFEMDIVMSADFDYSKYNELSPADYEIPDSVISSAAAPAKAGKALSVIRQAA